MVVGGEREREKGSPVLCPVSLVSLLLRQCQHPGIRSLAGAGAGGRSFIPRRVLVGGCEWAYV